VGCSSVLDGQCTSALKKGATRAKKLVIHVQFRLEINENQGEHHAHPESARVVMLEIV
jgi:hypothetical protein